MESAPLREQSPAEQWQTEYKAIFEKAINKARTVEQLATVVEMVNMDGAVYQEGVGSFDANRMAQIIRGYSTSKDSTLLDEGVSDIVVARLLEITKE